nr:hypothetical protein [Tanacetum cinerariifolium]
MAETMEQYMSKTQEDYESGVASPKIEDKDYFELKGQFLKELRTNTFSGLIHQDANEHIELVLEIVEVVLFYNGLDVPTRQILDSKGAILSKTVVDAKRSVMNQEASIKTLVIQTGQMSKVLKERGFRSLPSSTGTNPRDHVKLISTVVEADVSLIHRASVGVMSLSTYLNLGLGELAHTKLIVEFADMNEKYPKGIAENVLVEARLMGEALVLNRSLDPFFEDYIELKDLNVPLELRRDQVDDLIPTIKEDFAVLEDMNVYRDEGIGNVIFGEPFLREVGVNARWF